MIQPADNLLFAKINVLPSLDKKLASKEILNLSDDLSFWDSYRNTKMFPLMTKGANVGIAGASNYREGEFNWTSYTPKVIIDWFEEYVFPWIGVKARVMALVTLPGVANYEHIDCQPNELNTKQHKFRIVIQGRTDTLYWLTNQGQIAAPKIEEAFVMDGGWPHGMVNTTDEIKVTLALGAPWHGNDIYGDDITILQHRNDFIMPDKIDHLWNK